MNDAVHTLNTPHESIHSNNELSWPLLRLDGPRPEELSADPAGVLSPHCTRLMACEIMRGLESNWGMGIEVDGPWAIEAKSIWEKLGYGEDLASLDGRYTRWLNDDWALRSQTSALIPDALAKLAISGWTGGVLVLPGRVWRRDLRDKIHIGDPRQMDVWVLKPNWKPTRDDLLHLIQTVMNSGASKTPWTALDATHPYTVEGLEVEALWEGKPLEILECGLAHPDILEKAGLAGWGGLALGMGLDRLCMLRKNMNDIRDLDSPDPKAIAQVSDLKPWKKWSRQPAAVRDISIAISDQLVAEQVVDLAAAALTRPDLLEAIDVVGRWLPEELPLQALDKLGMKAHQANWLLRLRLRDWNGSVARDIADEQARLAWDALHQGSGTVYRPG